MDKCIKQYISFFRKNAKEQKKKGNIRVYLIYKHECSICQEQFSDFRDKFKVTFQRGQNQWNKKYIIDRIYPIKFGTKEYKKIEEKYVSITHFPAWIKIKEPYPIRIGHFGKGYLLDNIVDYKPRKKKKK